MNITSCNVSLRYAPGITTKQIPIPTQTKLIKRRYLRSNYPSEEQVPPGSEQPFTTTATEKNMTTSTSTDNNNTVYISTEQHQQSSNIAEATINPFVRIHLRQI
jgi:transposase